MKSILYSNHILLKHNRAIVGFTIKGLQTIYTYFTLVILTV